VSHSLEQVKIAKRYVNSLFAGLTTKKDMDAVAKDIADLGAMINGSTDLQNFTKSPLVSVTDHKDGMAKLAKKAKFSTPVSNLLSVMADNRRLNILPTLVSETQNYLAKQSGTVPVAIATARALSATDQKKIGADIKKAVGQDIAMQAYVDETLIGGMVIQIESTLIDGSIKSKLDKLERDLTRKVA
jgi:F-type H+-transporting ATPase subunit delta